MKSPLINKIFCILLFLIINIISSKSQTLTDFDGNEYATVSIGIQVWMAENLKTTRYSDGTPIEEGAIIDTVNWNDTIGRFYYYNNNPAYMQDYGLLYDWYASIRGTTASSNNPSGIKGVCPTGWHIPSISEWKILEDYLGDTIAESLIINGSSGFNAKFAGTGGPESPFQGLGESSGYISSDGEIGPYSRIYLKVITNEPRYFTGRHSKICGYSVRCVQDSFDISSSYYLESNSKINLYPNPCKNYFYIDLNETENKNISIYSITGKLIKTKNIHGKDNISVADFDNGIYIVTILNENNIYSEKLIIRK